MLELKRNILYRNMNEFTKHSIKMKLDGYEVICLTHRPINFENIYEKIAFDNLLFEAEYVLDSPFFEYKIERE